jgi:peptidoglycan/LPS O-acetylase OafA/YrhL
MQTTRNNNFDFIRFLAAVMVWYGHCYALLKLPEPLVVDFYSFGSFGVAVFFIISGYFITASYDQRKKFLPFVKSRILRVFPGLGVVILLSVFVVGSLLTNLTFKQYFADPETWTYLKSMLALPMHYELPGVFSQNPVHAVNGSLWSLKREVKLYMIIALLGVLGILRPRLMIAIFIATYVMRFYNIDMFEKYFVGLPEKLKDLQLESLFAGGSLIYLARDRLTLNFKFFVLAIFLMISSIYMPKPYNQIFFDLALTYMVIYIGFAKLPILPMAGKYGDFSYGFYLYAFPVQQICIHLMGKNLNFTAFLFASFVATFICAVLSWNFVEKPALALK